MSFNFSPKIITDDLILYLDSANTKSYLSSAPSKWRDISKNDNDIVFGNNPTFNSSNLGSLLFDGINDYGYNSYNSDFDLSSTDYTLEGWFNSNSFSSGQMIISNDTFGSSFDWCLFIQNSTQIAIYSNGTATNVTATVPTMSTGQWYHFVVTSISGVIRIYLNSILYQTQTMSTSNVSQLNITLGCSGWNNPNSFMNGKISIIKVYRKGLSENEVLQNYNTIKGRFNL